MALPDPRSGVLRRAVLVVVLALLASLVVPATSADASVDRDAERSMACQVDAYRRANGEQPHRIADDLTRLARQHAQEMARQNRLHHNPSLGSDVNGWSRVGENVGVGPTIDSVHSALVASTGHRRNLLDGRMTEIGIGVYRSGSRTWVVQVFRTPSGSAQGSTASCGRSYVPPGGTSVVGDWNGDGRHSPGRFVDGTWYLSNGLSSGADLVFNYGRPGDKPVVGDWNGNGRYGVGVVRNGRWHLRQTPSGGNAQISFNYGSLEDIPFAGDWNGNGRYGVGIVRDGEWHLRQTPSGGNGQIVFTYGRVTRGDVPFVGDWNANGKHGVGIVRNGAWHLRQTPSGGPGQTVFTYGRVTRGDVPVIGDWNGNGRASVGIVRDGRWYLRHDQSGGPAQFEFNY